MFRYSRSGTVQYLPCYRRLAGTLLLYCTYPGRQATVALKEGTHSLRFRLALWPDDPQKGRTKFGGRRGYPCSWGDPFCRRRPASTGLELTNSNRRCFFVLALTKSVPLPPSPPVFLPHLRTQRPNPPDNSPLFVCTRVPLAASKGVT